PRLPAPPRAGDRPGPARDPGPVPRRDVPGDPARREPRPDPGWRPRAFGWEPRPARLGHRFHGPRIPMATNRTTPGTILHLPSEESANEEEFDDMKKNAYLVVWWMSQVPYAAVFENRVAAEAAESVRNALMGALSGGSANLDYA